MLVSLLCKTMVLQGVLNSYLSFSILGRETEKIKCRENTRRAAIQVPRTRALRSQSQEERR